MDFIKEAVRQNEHWETGKISFPRLEGALVEREAYGQMESSAKRKFITVLRGLRRTGKSFLARQFIDGFLRRENDPLRIAWFEFDRAMNAKADDLDSLISFFCSRGSETIILDEIVFVRGWQDVLKRFYDRGNIKFIATGSSALEMDKRSAESLAGRFELVPVKPFSFAEYLLANGMRAPSGALEFAKKGEEMELQCGGYIRTGGLPEAILKSAEERREYIEKSLLDPLFYKDIPAVFPEAKPDMLRKSLEVLSATSGSIFQHQSLAQVLGCSHPVASFQVEVLERAFLVKTIYNLTPSVVKQKRTGKKIVFLDNGVLSAVRQDAPIGALAENAAANSFEKAKFWRDAEGREVDFVLPSKKLAVEVKYQEHITGADEKHLRYFLERNAGWKGIVLTKNEGEKSDIERMPLWRWLLEKRI